MAAKESRSQMLGAEKSDDAIVRLDIESADASGWAAGGGFGDWTGDGSPVGYEALISGNSLNGSAGTGVFVSYSFLEDVPAEYATEYPDGLDTFQPLTDAQKDLAREALAAWAKVSGITFFEVAPQDGDIRFGVYDLSTISPDADESAFAYLPTVGGEGMFSDVFIDKFDAEWFHLYLHEIGHALGLKHPFDGAPMLPADRDNFHNTVMSYTSGGEQGDVLGKLDIKAIRHLYGDSGDKGEQIDAWSWDATNLILTQRGDRHDEQIIGIGGDDRIWAGRGNDTVFTKEGDDIVYGESGDDSISAGAGDDRIDGGAGRDSLSGDAGNDTLDGGDGADTLSGGDGSDYFYLDDGDYAYDLGNGGIDTVESRANGVSLGQGIETLLMVGAAVYGTGNELANRIVGTDRGNRLSGLVGSDTLLGNGGSDTLLGGNDKDSLDGGAGNDSVSGGAGRDRLIGGSGHDLLDGGRDADTMQGGTGNDVYIVDNKRDIVVENAKSGLDRIESSASIILAANVEDLTLLGRENLSGKGNEGRNVITGNAGANGLNGMAGTDTVIGGDGNDTLVGGTGEDVLIGGAGRDLFRFAPGDSSAKLAHADHIVDFEKGDRIDLSAIDAIAGGSDNGFRFIGEDAFSRQAGELRVAHLDQNTLVAGDMNGDGKADFIILLSGDLDLARADFIF